MEIGYRILWGILASKNFSKEWSSQLELHVASDTKNYAIVM